MTIETFMVVIITLLVFIAILLSILLGILIGKSLKSATGRSSNQDTGQQASPDKPNTKKPEDIKILLNKIEEYHIDDIRRANNDKYQYLSYILWGFTLATLGLALTSKNNSDALILGTIAVVFLFSGYVSLLYSNRFRR